MHRVLSSKINTAWLWNCKFTGRLGIMFQSVQMKHAKPHWSWFGNNVLVVIGPNLVWRWYRGSNVGPIWTNHFELTMAAPQSVQGWVIENFIQEKFGVFWIILTRVKTLSVREPSYLGLTKSISWLLTPWLLESPGHQHPWCWPCRIGKSLPYLREDFNFLFHVNVEEWHKMYIYIYIYTLSKNI